ncbi:MAG: 3-oxoadipate--succinyl-CoA transferase subunit A [Chloroflexi bacterium]|nr:MAG: 3-oxoadipate--succinyl-CoA transferase subunit A [Chloroflexota bacterium]
MSKLTTMHDAVATLVHDGDTIAIEGFTHLICFAAAHEIIRQGRRDLTVCRMTPDLVYDQMVAAGCVRKLIFSYLGNPGVGSLYPIRRAVEQGIPQPLELEEYTHFGLVARYLAGAANLPFYPLRSFTGSDLPAANPLIRQVDDPYGSGPIYVVPPIHPDVTIVHVQRADANGNAQIWGLLGMQAEAAFAARRVIVVAEEIVDETVIRRDPNRTVIPSLIVDAVVHEPHGAHPAYVQGYYDRDGDFYLAWDRLSQSHEETIHWLDEWVYGVADRAEYVAKLGEATWARLDPGEAWSGEVNYGVYR